jgi:hypothetical protein
MCSGVVDCVDAVLYAWKDKDYIYLVLEWAPEVCGWLQHAEYVEHAALGWVVLNVL